MRQFIQGVRNLIKWFPIVWADRDWDYSFTYRSLQFKMEQQANHLSENTVFVNSQAYADHARTMAKLIEHNLDNYYGIEYFDYHEADWEFTPVEDKPGCTTLDIRVISEDFDSYFAKYPRVYKQILAGKINTGWEVDILDKSNIAFAISQYNEQRCKRILYAMLEKDLEKLWT
jgi:hypothetical protein